jgi:multidrug efflux pump subunit AcrA (membrane-fusion protein)
MNLFSRLLRYLTFALAIAGVFMMGQVMKTLHGQEVKIPPPPVKPPEKHSETDIGATGILEARDENVAIGVPGPGLVQEVKVVVNQVVKKGDALLRLDDRELQASLLRQRPPWQLERPI